MSIPIQLVLSEDFFEEDASFLETCSLETYFLETCFLETCFLETQWFGGYNVFLTQKLFITFSERGMISTPMITRGTKAQGRVNAPRGAMQKPSCLEVTS